MGKRFIDTGLFDDEWFSELSIKAKLMWVYYLTKCDHAGLLKYNKKLMTFQTTISDIDTTIKELGNRIVRVNEVLLFCPKFIEFQYPDFINSKLNAAVSAHKMLIKLNIDYNSYITLPNPSEDLPKSPSIGIGIGISIGNKAFVPNFDSIPETHREALRLWFTYKREKGETYKSIGWTMLVSEMLKKYPTQAAFENTLNYSIANNYSGLFADKNNTPNKPEPIQHRHDLNDELAAMQLKHDNR